MMFPKQGLARRGFGVHSDVLSMWTLCWGFGLPPSEAGHVEMFATFWGGDKSSEESKARCGKFFCTGPDVITLHVHQ